MKQGENFAELQTLNRNGVMMLLDKQDSAQLALLEDSYRKSDSLANIANRNRELLQEETVKQDEVINTLKQQVLDHEREVNSQTETFSAAIKRREAEVYAEAATAAVGAILSIFTGGFDPNKVYKTIQKAVNLAKKLKKIVKVAEVLKKLLDKLKNIGQTLRNLYDKIKTRLTDLFEKLKSFLTKGLDAETDKKVKELTKKRVESYTKAKDIVEAVIVARKAATVAKLGFNPANDWLDSSKSQEIIRRGSKLNAVDVLEWDRAREHVIGKMSTYIIHVYLHFHSIPQAKY